MELLFLKLISKFINFTESGERYYAVKNRKYHQNLIRIVRGSF